MTSIFLPSSAITQISYAVKFNMADKVHRLSLAASFFLYIVYVPRQTTVSKEEKNRLKS